MTRTRLAASTLLLLFQACTDDETQDPGSAGRGGSSPTAGNAGASGLSGHGGKGGAGGSSGGTRAGNGGSSHSGSGGSPAGTAGATSAGEAGASGAGGDGTAGNSGEGGSSKPNGAGGATSEAGGGGDAGAHGGEGGAGGAVPCLEFVPDASCTSGDAPLPNELRCTGLYGDWATRRIACGVTEFTPAYELWSDGAEKRRFVALPAGSILDISDPDNWVFPDGTRFWKEFWVGAGSTKTLGETRLLQKTSAGWLYTTYVWSADGTHATQTNDGVEDLFDSGHVVPTRDQCRTCHRGRPDFVLGWDALMLGPGARGLTLARLGDAGRLSGPAPVAAIPGDSVERAALGYLHANCGVSCHNTTDFAQGRSSSLFLRLELGALESVQETNAVLTGVNRIPDANVALPPGGPYYDLRPLDPARSLILERMSRRDEFAMPRLGTHAVDPSGIAAVTAWIESMTTERGYPAAEP